MKTEDEINKQLIQLFQSSEYVEARTLCEEILELDSQAHFALFILGTIDLVHKRLDSAARWLRKAIQADPNNAPYYSNLGVCYNDLGQLDDAIEAHNSAIALNPKVAEFYMNLGVTMQRAQRFEEAVESTRRALELRPNHPDNTDWILTYGARLTEQGRYTEARDAYLQALKIPTTKPKVLYQLGIVHELMNDWIAALNYFELAASKDPQYHLRRGLAAIKVGNYDIALSALKAFQSHEPYRRRTEVSALIVNAEVRIQLEAALPRLLHAAPISQREEALATALPTPLNAHDTWLTTAIETTRQALDRKKLGQLAIVFFHIDIGDLRRSLIETVPEIDDEPHYVETLKLACEAARLTNPQASLLLITDEHTDTSQFMMIDNVIRLPLSRETLALSRLQAYYALASSDRLPERVAFIDTDVCLARDLAPIFKDQFDAGLIYQKLSNSPATPIDPSVIFGSTLRPQKLVQFFSDCLTIYEWVAHQPCLRDAHGFDTKLWYGDWYALAAFTNWQTPEASSNQLSVRGIDCKLFPGAEYSRTVHWDDEVGTLSHSWALHFRGFGVKSKMRSFVQHLKQLPLSHHEPHSLS